MQRAYRYRYQSTIGCAIIIGMLTGLVLYHGVRSRFCSKCSYVIDHNIPLISDQDNSTYVQIRRCAKYRVKKKDDPNHSVKLSQLLSGPFTLPDDDPALVHHIRDALNAPPTEGLLKLDNSVKKEDPVHAGQVGQVLEVEKYFENKEGGFYVEAGAWDGEWLSNTLFLEVKRNWTGLLVEPNLGAFTTLMGRNRKSYTINCCLATKGYPEKVTFDAADVFGGIVDPDSDQGGAVPQLRDSIPKDMRAKYTVQCYPLYSLLLAMGNPRVDFLSLDIEGSELAVLQTMPWSKVNIEMVMVEVEHSDVSQVTKVMNKAGFMKYKSFGMQDVIYVKNKENTLG